MYINAIQAFFKFIAETDQERTLIPSTILHEQLLLATVSGEHEDALGSAA